MNSPLLSKQYILDTNILRTIFGYYYPEDLFPEIWQGLRILDAEGLLASVHAVKKECDNQQKDNKIFHDWLDNHRFMFTMPTGEELDWVSKISENKEFQLSDEQIEKGKNYADKFLIAKGKAVNGIVVTDEAYRPYGFKIPRICEVYGVECINRIEFIRRLREINSLSE